MVEVSVVVDTILPHSASSAFADAQRNAAESVAVNTFRVTVSWSNCGGRRILVAPLHCCPSTFF